MIHNSNWKEIKETSKIISTGRVRKKYDATKNLKTTVKDRK